MSITRRRNHLGGMFAKTLYVYSPSTLAVSTGHSLYISWRFYLFSLSSYRNKYHYICNYACLITWHEVFHERKVRVLHLTYLPRCGKALKPSPFLGRASDSYLEAQLFHTYISYRNPIISYILNGESHGETANLSANFRAVIRPILFPPHPARFIPSSFPYVFLPKIETWAWPLVLWE